MYYNDYELIYLVKDNDEVALNLMIKKYEPIIKKLASYYAIKYKKLRVDKEDMEQECRLCLVRALSLFDPKKDVLFYSYILMCFRRCIFNHIRKYDGKTRCNDLVDIDSEDNYIQLQDYYYLEPTYLVSEYEVTEKIIRFKNDLDFIDSQIFEMKLNSFSYRDIALFLGIKQKEVDNRLLKIRGKLKKSLLNF